MAYELKNMTGTLFENDKAGNDKRPDRRGECCIDGKIYRISGWIKTSQKGKRYLSLSFSAPVPQTDKISNKAKDESGPPYGDEQQFKEEDIPI